MEEMELEDKTVREVEYFFASYNRLDGKDFKVIGKSGPKKAIDIVKAGEKLYDRNGMD